MLTAQVFGGVFGWMIAWALCTYFMRRELLVLEEDLEKIRNQYDK
jgi:membrane protein YqaA with SNARE-associated domain